jgi:excisionase family DNA binding protein
MRYDVPLPTSLDRLLTVSEVAIHCRVVDSTVRKWCKRGLLPYIRLGSRDIRVRLQDVVAFTTDTKGWDAT